MRYIPSLILSLCTFYNFAIARNTLTETSNLFRDADSLCLSQVECEWTDVYGDSCLWDFSDLKIVDEMHTVKYSLDSLCRLTKEENLSLSHYAFTNQTLSIEQYETPLWNIEYETPLLYLALPLTFGDSVAAVYSGAGQYCQSLYTTETGQVLQQGDGCGSLILNHGDTVKNVLRVHTIITKAQTMWNDTTRSEVVNQVQTIDDRYDWYARGYRYPLFQYLQKTTYKNLKPIATVNRAYEVVLSSRSQPSDLTNDSIRAIDSLYSEGRGIIPITYHVENTNNQIKLYYQLHTTATIEVLLFDSMGVMYGLKRQRGNADDLDLITFDIGSLHAGQYILYIHVNDQVFNEKVSK